MQKRIVISVSSDLVTDQRVHKVAGSLQKMGFVPVLIGRQLKSSLPLQKRSYTTHRLRLFFEKGPFFYAELTIRLLCYLLARRADVLLANDLDTLLPNYIVSKIKRVPLVYDSHEYFTGVPELVDRPIVRSIWKRLEQCIFPRLKYIYTVNASIKNLYETEYGVSVKVVRNVPFKKEKPGHFPVKPIKKIILYQGAVNRDRGLEEMITAMQYLPDYCLHVVGGGDVLTELQQMVARFHLENQVIFFGKIPLEQLSDITSEADLGISLEKDTNINYRFSLPNKLFDYIQAGLPVLASRLVEIEKIIDQYPIGCYIDHHDPRHIASRIEEAFSDTNRFNHWRSNLRKAADELCWQNEESVLKGIFARFL